jgi:hypothetical protein
MTAAGVRPVGFLAGTGLASPPRLPPPPRIGRPRVRVPPQVAQIGRAGARAPSGAGPLFVRVRLIGQPAGVAPRAISGGVVAAVSLGLPGARVALLAARPWIRAGGCLARPLLPVMPRSVMPAIRVAVPIGSRVPVTPPVVGRHLLATPRGRIARGPIGPGAGAAPRAVRPAVLARVVARIAPLGPLGPLGPPRRVMPPARTPVLPARPVIRVLPVIPH